MGVQTSPDYGRNPFVPALEQRRAQPVDTAPAANTAGNQPSSQPPAKSDNDKAHPANMLMNLLLNKGSVPTQQPAPTPAPTDK
jgi:hypothetical protein